MISNSNNVHMNYLSFKDSPQMHIAFGQSTNIHASNLTVTAPPTFLKRLHSILHHRSAQATTVFPSGTAHPISSLKYIFSAAPATALGKNKKLLSFQIQLTITLISSFLFLYKHWEPRWKWKASNSVNLFMYVSNATFNRTLNGVGIKT